jgi:hypothetical protein
MAGVKPKKGGSMDGSLKDKLLSIAKDAGVDVLVAMSPENFAYVAQAYIITVELLRPRHQNRGRNSQDRICRKNDARGCSRSYGG